MITPLHRVSYIALAALALPLVGYSILVILTFGFAGLLLVVGMKMLAMMIYMSGLIPTLATAIFYELLLHKRTLWLSIPSTAVFGVAAAVVWWRVALNIDLLRPNYGIISVLVSTALAVILIPIVRFALDKELRQEERVTSQ